MIVEGAYAIYIFGASLVISSLLFFFYYKAYFLIKYRMEFHEMGMKFKSMCIYKYIPCAQ